MAETQKNAGNGYAYLIVFTLILIMLFPMSFALSCLGIILPPASESLGVSPATLSYYISISAAINIILLPFYGKIFNKVDVRIIVSVAVIMTALGFAIQSQAQQLWQFYAVALLVGGGMPPLLYLAPTTLINKWFAKKRAGFFIGLVMAFMGIGGAIWNPVGGIIIQALGWRATLLTFAGLTLVCVLPFTIFALRGDPSEKGLLPVGAEASDDAQTAPAQNVDGITAKEAARMPSFILLLVFAVLLNLGLYAYQMIPSYVATLPISATMPLLGATLASVAMVSQTVAKLVWGAVGERKPIIVIIVGLILGIVGVLGVWGANGAVVLTVAAVICYGFYYALTNVMNPIVTRQYYGMKDYAQIYSRVSMAATLGNLIGTFFWGTLINMTGSYTVMFVGIACAFVLAIVAIYAANASMKKVREQNQ